MDDIIDQGIVSLYILPEGSWDVEAQLANVYVVVEGYMCT